MMIRQKKTEGKKSRNATNASKKKTKTKQNNTHY